MQAVYKSRKVIAVITDRILAFVVRKSSVISAFSYMLIIVVVISQSWLVVQSVILVSTIYSARQFLRLSWDELRLLEPVVGNLTQPLSEKLMEFEKQVSDWEAKIPNLRFGLIILFAFEFVNILAILYLANLSHRLEGHKVSAFLTSLPRTVFKIGVPVAAAQLSGCLFFLASANTARLQYLASHLNLLHILSPGGVEATYYLIHLTGELYTLAMERAISLLILMILSLIAIIVTMAVSVESSGKMRIVTIAISLLMTHLLLTSIAGSAVVIWQLFV